jgi:hypothetical protein
MPEFTGVITEPGLYPDVPEDLYHGDPVMGGSLSVSGAKLLLQAPAKYDYARRNGSKSTDAMKLGTVVHSMVLGKGQEITVLAFDDRRTKAYKLAEAEAVDAGCLPMLAKDYDEARAIADALLAHPTTGGLLTEGDAEVSMFWRDEEFGIWLRARGDYLTYFGGLPTIVDVKKTADGSPEEFARSAYKYGYYRQDPWYREGWASLLGCDPGEIDFVFACVEPEPPYLVATYRIAGEHAELGREQNRIARERYRDCVKSGRWPGYSEEIEDLELPRYGVQRIEKDINEWYQ